MLSTLMLHHLAYGETKTHARMQGADKITARTYSFTLQAGEQYQFGTLLIDLFHCDRTSPQEIPESSAFLQIKDKLSQSNTAFSGWMFASSPALNALEHPIYDVWLIECLNL